MNAYIPNDVWYEFPSGVSVETVGTFATLDAPLSKINVHVRGGFVIPMQIPGPNLIVGRGNPFTLLVAQSRTGTGSGNLFWDDGDSIGRLTFFFVSLFRHLDLFRFHRDQDLQLSGVLAEQWRKSSSQS